jgi:hypothetical protein
MYSSDDSLQEESESKVGQVDLPMVNEQGNSYRLGKKERDLLVKVHLSNSCDYDQHWYINENGDKFLLVCKGICFDESDSEFMRCCFSPVNNWNRLSRHKNEGDLALQQYIWCCWYFHRGGIQRAHRDVQDLLYIRMRVPELQVQKCSKRYSSSWKPETLLCESVRWKIGRQKCMLQQKMHVLWNDGQAPYTFSELQAQRTDSRGPCRLRCERQATSPKERHMFLSRFSACTKWLIRANIK